MNGRSHRVFRAAGLVLVFVLGGLAALGTEWLRVRAAKRWTATAEVSYPIEWHHLAHGGRGQSSAPLTPQAALDDALTAIGGHTKVPIPVDDLRATIHQENGKWLRICFFHSSRSADRAVVEVNTIAGAYAAHVQLAVARQMLREVAEYRGTDKRLKEELGTIGPELDLLADRAVTLAAYRSDSRTPGEKRSSEPQMPGKEPPPGGTGVFAPSGPERNPRTTLEALRERRDALLRDRTPAHPDVQHVEAMIAEAENQMEELPLPSPQTAERPQRELRPAVDATSLAAAPPTPVQAAASRDAAQWSELFRAIQTLQVRLEALSQAVQKTRQREFDDPGAALRDVEVGVRWAEQTEVFGPQVPPWAFVWTAVAAGLVLTAGTGMIFLGVGIDSPIERGEEKELNRVLGLALVGTLQALEPATTTERGLSTRWKAPCILAGAVVIAAYVTFLLQPLLI